MILLGALSVHSPKKLFCHLTKSYYFPRGRDVAVVPPLHPTLAHQYLSCAPYLFPSRLRCLSSTDTDLLLTFFLTSPYSSAPFNLHAPCH